MSMYKLVKDDFKSDKSNLHLAHATIMMALCHMIMEPGKPKETCMLLDGIQQLIGSHEVSRVLLLSPTNQSINL